MLVSHHDEVGVDFAGVTRDLVDRVAHHDLAAHAVARIAEAPQSLGEDRLVAPAFLLLAARVVHEPLAAEDRKSTRLNSSHPSISYAVFCLKKKKHILTM